MGALRLFIVRCLLPGMLGMHGLSAAQTVDPAHVRPDYPALSRHALAAGDFRGAADLLERALETAGPEQWRPMALETAELRLRSGEPDRAERLLAEFELRYPDHNLTERKILRADILLARDQFGPAARLYNELTTSAGLSKTQMDSVMTRLITARLGEEKYEEAAEIGERLEKIAATPETEFAARVRRIYALQAAGKLQESAALLADAAPFQNASQQDVKTKLDLLQLLLSRKISDFKKQYTAFITGRSFEKADFLTHRLSRAAGELFAAGEQPDEAIASYQIAFRTATREDDRRGALLELANVQMNAGRQADAAETLLKYLAFYPNDPDSVNLEMQAGRLFAAAGKHREAIRCFEKLTGNEQLPLTTRLESAREAALTAEQGKLDQEAMRFLRYLIDHAADAAQRQDGYYLLGEHYYRRQEYGRAAEAFATAAEEPAVLQEKAVFWQLQALLKAGNYTAAMPVGERLRKAEDPELRAAAEYFLAVLLDRTGKIAEAADAYLKFAAAHPESEFAPQAVFDAALIAEKQNNHRVAAERYADFVSRFPTHILAANALFKAMQAAFVSRDDTLMRRTSDTLTQNYPDSEYTISALFLQVDFLAGENRFQAALSVLDRIAALAKEHPDRLAQCYYDQARINARLDHTEKALQLLTQLLEKHLATPVAADAALLAANLYSDHGDYQRAAELYERAKKLRPGGRFADVCEERIADCEFSRAAATHDRKLFKNAAERYRKLVEKNDPGSIYSCLYKLGRSREFAGNARGALAAYGELLYRAVEARRQNRYFDTVWVGKGVYAAAMLHLKKASPAAAREALRILEIARQLDLRTGEDFDKMAADIRARYKI